METIITKRSFSKAEQLFFGKEYVKAYYMRPEEPESYWKQYEEEEEVRIKHVNNWVAKINNDEVFINELICMYTPIKRGGYELLIIITFEGYIEDEQIESNDFHEGIMNPEMDPEVHLLGVNLVIAENY